MRKRDNHLKQALTCPNTWKQSIRSARSLAFSAAEIARAACLVAIPLPHPRLPAGCLLQTGHSATCKGTCPPSHPASQPGRSPHSQFVICDERQPLMKLTTQLTNLPSNNKSDCSSSQRMRQIASHSAMQPTRKPSLQPLRKSSSSFSQLD